MGRVSSKDERVFWKDVKIRQAKLDKGEKESKTKYAVSLSMYC